MWRTLWTAWAGMAALLGGGCATGPLLDNPVFVRPDPDVHVENPVYIPQGGHAYNAVFEQVLDVMDDYFEISYANRYDGHIESFPRIAPGLEQLWKPGSPDFYQRLEATWQTIRHRASVLIEPALDGGFFIHVTAHQALEDLHRPTRATAGTASFRS